MPVAQPKDLAPCNVQPPSTFAARVLMVMAAASDLTDSLAKLASHLRSLPIAWSTLSANARTTGASSLSNNPASSALSESVPRDAEVR